jgi:hypothetical protein
LKKSIGSGPSYGGNNGTKYLCTFRPTVRKGESKKFEERFADILNSFADIIVFVYITSSYFAFGYFGIPDYWTKTFRLIAGDSYNFLLLER